ncbi:MAG TPA: subclass B3 metallo-beta-lactamase [Steroidobacteraceae bacterium]|nr:subclass B3 metallo-beta-lactamase [Steroidobacteraceae bacterium]
MSKLCILVLAFLFAQSAQAEPACAHCAAWNKTQQPFRIYGNTYYVGVHGLSSILITSDQGHVLIDGDLRESPAKIAASIAKLGFRIEDVKLILNSHVHHDHAGGIAKLQHLSGATVAASASSARVLMQGHSGPDDPLYGELRSIPAVRDVKIVKDGETLHVGSLELTAHLTPGHTPGGTSWTWKSCENQRCLHMVYADSLMPIAASAFRFTHNSNYPNVLEDFQKSFTTLNALPCDILLTPHPDLSEFLSARLGGTEVRPMVDATACRRYAEAARERLSKRVARENSQ